MNIPEIKTSDDLIHQMQIEQEKVHKAFSNLFNSDDGQFVLDFLRKEYLEKPVAKVGMTPDYAFFREGQNDAIREIINLTEGEL